LSSAAPARIKQRAVLSARFAADVGFVGLEDARRRQLIATLKHGNEGDAADASMSDTEFAFGATGSWR